MKKIALLLVVLTSVIIAACGSSEPEDIVVTLDWFQNANHAGIYTALDEGYFDDEGLNVTVEPPADPAAILGLVASGQSEFAFYYQPDLLQARQEGIPVVAVAGIVQRPLNSIMTLKSSGIEKPSQLVGKKVGTPGLPWNEAMLTTMLEADGVSRDDVEVVDVGWTASQALMAGTVDAIIGVYWTYESIIMDNEGYETNVLMPDDWDVPSYYELVLVTSEANVKDRPEMVEDFVKAFNKGYGNAAADPQGSIDTMIRLNPEAEIDEATDRAGVELLAPLWKSEGAPVGSFDDARWNTLVDWMKAADLLDESMVAVDAYESSLSK
ncbi:MAG: ABC transporter substrate-binding protein [Dehalococcoidia bacterium]|jgi:putative hydroxymethylpyrimidine transport system substrate-binding protein|nr:ABC transporter substrate-binding protein [Dehalococcoidia bacterium]